MKIRLLTVTVSFFLCCIFAAQAQPCSANLIADSSFEAGTPNPDWAESSTNFGSPLCTYTGCGNGDGTGPNTGLWWAWFGGVTLEEVGSVSQDIVLPANSTANLYFYLEVPSCENLAQEYMSVVIDNIDTLFTVTNFSPLCGVIGYTLQTINLDTYCDGNSHNILFYSYTNSFVTSTNFFVDDVSLIACPISSGYALHTVSNRISIHPNPAHNRFTISCGELNIENGILNIYDVMGREVHQQTLNTKLQTLNTNLSSGIYFVQVRSGQKVFTEKLVVE
jgi:hypothetical protein